MDDENDVEDDNEEEDDDDDYDCPECQETSPFVMYCSQVSAFLPSFHSLSYIAYLLQTLSIQ